MAKGAPAYVSPKSRDDISFVMDTFQLTIASLKEKEKELSVLRDRAEERARSAGSLSESVLKNIQSGVVTFDAGGTVVTANDAAGTILARDGNALTGGRSTGAVRERELARGPGGESGKGRLKPEEGGRRNQYARGETVDRRGHISAFVRRDARRRDTRVHGHHGGKRAPGDDGAEREDSCPWRDVRGDSA